MARSRSITVEQWAEQRPARKWKTVRLRNASRGPLEVEILAQRVWLWDGQEERARRWHLIVRRELNSPAEIKSSLSNAPAGTPWRRLAFMQGQRFWVERALQDAKSEVGMGQYQVRGWKAWHHHMALCMMSLLFMLETRIFYRSQAPLLSCADVRTLMDHFLPKRDRDTEEILRQMKRRHQQRRAATQSAIRKKEPLNQKTKGNWLRSIIPIF